MKVRVDVTTPEGLLSLVALKYSVELTKKNIDSSKRKYLNTKYKDYYAKLKELRELRRSLEVEDNPKEIRNIQKRIMELQKEISHIRDNIMPKDQTLQYLKEVSSKAKGVIKTLDNTIMQGLRKQGYEIRALNKTDIDRIESALPSNNPRSPPKKDSSNKVEVKSDKGVPAPAKPGRE